LTAGVDSSVEQSSIMSRGTITPRCRLRPLSIQTALEPFMLQELRKATVVTRFSPRPRSFCCGGKERRRCSQSTRSWTGEEAIVSLLLFLF
jgi:hypothetical protein